MTIFTIGHSNRSLDELVSLLRAFRIELVVDVRHYPRSRNNPQFNRETLAVELPRANIAYRHFLPLGGRRSVALDSPNAGWEEAAFRGYADYALTPDFARALEELVALGEKRRVAIMCAEAVWWRCHRRIITDYLLVRGIEVRHILSKSRADEATLTPFAKPLAGGKVAYPAPRLGSSRATP